MYKKISIYVCVLMFFSCSKEIEFNAGLEDRLTAIIDMSPEGQSHKIDFISDKDTDDCNDHEIVTVTEHEDGSLDNKYYTIEIVARDYYREENNCNDYDEEEQLKHKLVIIAYTNELTSSMYITSSNYVEHPLKATAHIVAYYKLKQNEDGQDNQEQGIEYFGHNFEIEIIDLDLDKETITGMLNGTLYRGTSVAYPSLYTGVNNFPDVDLYNPTTGDYIDDLDLTDSIRIENCVFQRVNVVDNS